MRGLIVGAVVGVAVLAFAGAFAVSRSGRGPDAFPGLERVQAPGATPSIAGFSAAGVVPALLHRARPKGRPTLVVAAPAAPAPAPAPRVTAPAPSPPRAVAPRPAPAPRPPAPKKPPSGEGAPIVGGSG
jgi:hypothetical protein